MIIFLRGYSLFTFELVCVTTAVALSLSLALISSIPTMIDLYCNCHYLIGLLGWMNITSNMLQLGRFPHFGSNSGLLPIKTLKPFSFCGNITAKHASSSKQFQIVNSESRFGRIWIHHDFYAEFICTVL